MADSSGRKRLSSYVVHPNERKWSSVSSGKTDKAEAKKLTELASRSGTIEKQLGLELEALRATSQLDCG
jgi:hypothetical protein